MTLEIEKMLTASTACVTRETMDGLDHHQYANDYGAFLHVKSELEHVSVPADLRAVLEFARNSGCEWLKLDRDADVIPGLPHYNW